MTLKKRTGIGGHRIRSRLGSTGVSRLRLSKFRINDLEIVRSTIIDSGDTAPLAGLKLSRFSITLCLHRKGGGLMTQSSESGSCRPIGEVAEA
jgi:hypothetical protein